MFMIMSKCQSVISSSSRDLRDTVPTRDSRRDLNEILTVSTSNMHPSSSPSSLRGDRRVHRVPDLPREDKNLHTLRLSQHSSSPCSPRTEASAPVRSPPSTLVFPCDASRSAVFADRIVSRPPRAADPRTATARPDLALSSSSSRSSLPPLPVYSRSLSTTRDSTCLSLSICARFFTPSKRNLSSSSRPSRRSSSDNHESQNHTYCTGTGTGTPHVIVNTHSGAHRLFSALFVPREAQYRPPRLVLGLTGGPPTSFGGGSNHLRHDVLNTASR